MLTVLPPPARSPPFGRYHPLMKIIDTLPLEAALQSFSDEREWAAFHTPKNLAMALAGEVGELHELLQWKTDAEILQATQNSPAFRTALEDELADVLMYLVRLASVAGVDLNAAAQAKLQKNALKYPAAECRGRAKAPEQG